MAARCRGFASRVCEQPRGPHVYFLSLGAGNSTRKSRNRVISRDFVDDDATRLLLSPALRSAGRRWTREARPDEGLRGLSRYAPFGRCALVERYAAFETLIGKLSAAPHPAASRPPSPRCAGRGELPRWIGRHRGDVLARGILELTVDLAKVGVFERLLLKQQFGAALQKIAAALEDRDGALERLLDEALHRLVDRMRRLVAEAPLAPWAGLRRADQEGRARAFVGDRAERLLHAEAHDHVAGDVGDLGQIVGGAGREMAEYDPFRRPAAEQHRHPVFQLFARHQVAVLGRPLDRVAERADAARDDRDLVYLVGSRQRQSRQSVAH